MKRVLYLSNIQVPYRVRFFNELAKSCDLTVGYQSRGSQSRDNAWAASEASHFRVVYFPKLLGEIGSSYDCVIIGCYTSPVQILAMGLRKLLGKSYILNLDGEGFLAENSWKNRCKRFLLSGADGYLVAGEQAARNLRPFVEGKSITVYRFSSLTEAEIASHREAAARCRRDERILVVGQYFPYKGLDVALKAAAMDAAHEYLFVGMGNRSGKFLKEQTIPANVQVIPFLQKQELEALYQSCALLVLPSRQECWGLVVNEAASYGMPVVSTWGSGAAAEFLGERYPQYLAKPGDAEDLLRCIRRWFSSLEKEEYSAFLLEKSKDYYIGQNVQAHFQTISGGKEHGFCHYSRL